MVDVEVFDSTYDKLEKIADKHDITIADLISTMLDCFEENDGEDYIV